MSTLVIIAHIKDGADLARQHHLPQPIIDLIEQHHGTTLVEYFYDRATEQQQSDPNGGEVDESTFRYPGPKPQTKEAAVLMLADAVESASRTLVDPTPARIESLVREIAERRLHERPVRRKRPDPARAPHHRKKHGQVADLHLPRPDQVSRAESERVAGNDILEWCYRYAVITAFPYLLRNGKMQK